MKNILKKLHAIQGDIERMEKDGTNAFQNYKYLSETQITYKMKTLLDKHGVVMHYGWTEKSCVPFTTAKGGQQFLTTVDVNYTFFDVESGEMVCNNVSGQGADSGDKGIYKAITGAIKYLFMKTFNIPTGDDPENEKTNNYPAKVASAWKKPVPKNLPPTLRDDVPDLDNEIQL